MAAKPAKPSGGTRRRRGGQTRRVAPTPYELGAPEGVEEARRRIAAAAADEAAEVDLGGVGLTDEGLAALRDDLPSMPHVRALRLGYARAVAEKPYFQRTDEDKKLCNAVRTLPAAFLKAFPHIERLWLDGNQLTALPAEIGQLGSLEVLYLNQNQLTALPAEIGQLGKLERLYANGNQLTALPAEIGQLGKLLRLEIDRSQLTELPKKIGRLGSLKRLMLNHNQLAALPAEIGQLEELELLSLYSNQLSTLPVEIGQTRKLRGLWLNDNQLTALPAAIGQLEELELLSLDNNRLSALPAEIGQLGKLQELRLERNQLPDSYKTAFAQGGTSALGSLLDALLDGAESLYEAKLLIVGEGNVGKSWAFAALRGEDPRKVIGEDNTTYGVTLGGLSLPHPDVANATIRLNAWDFGGQKVYESTRQFFFSEDAVFLLVWNPRDGADKCRVRQWLRWIALRTGGRAKVIVVATHSPAGQAAYRADYGHDGLPADLRAMIIASIAIDSARKPDGGEGDNVQALRELIARHAAGLPRMGDPFPPKWQRARDAATGLGDRHYIHYDEFAGYCRDQGVTAPDQIFTLASVFMHRLGRAIYFGERRPAADGAQGGSRAARGRHLEFQDAQLADILVLDPEWLSRAMFQLVEDQPTIDAGGMLDHVDLDRIWRTHGRPDWQVYPVCQHPYLIGMMRRFDVSYVVKEREGQQSLVAELVPGTPPTDVPWFEPPMGHGRHVVRLACELRHEVPGLVPRLIVSTAPYHMTGEGGRGLFWSEGIFLRETTYENEALVRVEGTERPTVTIAICGPQPGYFIGELHRTLAAVLDFWKGLGTAYQVLCPARDDDGRLCSGTFRFDFLVKMDKQDPDRKHTCQQCLSEWTPGQLLSGLGAVREQSATDREKGVDRFLARGEAPCPRAFILEPVDRDLGRLGRLVDLVGGEKLRITLLSEHSYKPVEAASEVFDVKPEWVKWFEPVAKNAGLFISLATPFFGGGVADRLSAAAGFMKDLSDLPLPSGRTLDDEHARLAREGVSAFVTGAEAEVLHAFLKERGIAPRFGGMKLVNIRNKGWLWATAEEAAAHAEDAPRLSYVPKDQPPTPDRP